VKAFARGFGLALVSVVLMGVAGCGPADNETTASKNMGDPGAPDPKVKVSGEGGATKDMADYAKGRQNVNPYAKSEKYPGAKK
jgi:hypothetical protein